MKIEEYLKTLKARCAKEKKPRLLSHKLHHALAEIVKRSHEQDADQDLDFDEEEQQDRRRLSVPSAVDLVL